MIQPSDLDLEKFAAILVKLALLGIVVVIGGRIATYVLGAHPLSAL